MLSPITDPGTRYALRIVTDLDWAVAAGEGHRQLAWWSLKAARRASLDHARFRDLTPSPGDAA